MAVRMEAATAQMAFCGPRRLRLSSDRQLNRSPPCRAASGFTSGMLLGYAAYMFVHHATHHFAIQPGDWLYKARVRHMAHHYHDNAHFGPKPCRQCFRRRSRLAQRWVPAMTV